MDSSHLSHDLKPRLRGRLHQVAFFVSVPAGLALVMVARGAEARLATGVFTLALSGLYGVSAAYHRRRWSERAHRVMRDLDHSMIFVFIAASYTPLTVLALQPAWRFTLLVLTWSGAVVGVLLTFLRIDRWHGLGYALYLVLGWLGVVALFQLLRSLSAVELGLLVTGGLLYSVGAVILARRRPDPRPAIFGYHEVWHTLVVGASACHFALIALLISA